MQMLRVSTQKGVRTAEHPISRRYHVDHLNLHSSRLRGKWYVDWMPSKIKSLAQNTGAFVYTNGTFTEVCPMETHKTILALVMLKDFCEDVGMPERLKSDRTAELCGRKSEFLRLARKKQIDMRYVAPERKNQVFPMDLEI
ncbi:hypothetical protein ACHAWF_014514 [Thalassiosira exigua]